MSNRNPYDYYKSVSKTKEDLMDDQASEEAYVPFIVNRTLSYFPDTLFHANQMNRYHKCDKKFQYDYYLKAIRARSRFTKWAKSASSEDIDTIKEYYKYNDRRAQEALSILTSADIVAMRKQADQGGLKK